MAVFVRAKDDSSFAIDNRSVGCFGTQGKMTFVGAEEKFIEKTTLWRFINALE
ncbi:hypothetical protein GGQ88_004253 [Novosphingobium hassiacum]|uniref:Uncharacterized protein n=2 Tax=Novosphingobium TaxID=165696 RepID=A0A7W6A497_9SPHN|nr:hypothetical protein [Novosphingobium album (ex Liu et al. 2023)]MBB3862950.1 hypothetical protein [Novosphingobium hassiacum]MBK9005241.1 hypothetical protein [Sphingomonadales bacterium]MBK9269953.1 hypothetical protein [Sphingomonadales bacterium]MDE8653842.1 hypothetical protein [Novosphingobium album (ex Liu et al. 2023)]